MAYLCHESCEKSGGVFESGGGWSAQLRHQRTLGYANGDLTLEDIANNWDVITDFSKSDIPSQSGSSSMAALKSVQSSRSAPKHTPSSAPDNLSVYSGRRTAPISVPFSADQLILYALGIGAKVKHTDNRDLHFLYEGHENFAAIPSYCVIIGMKLSIDMVGSMRLIDHTQLLHGEQAFQVHSSLPTGGVVKGVAQVLEVLDKGKGALIVVEVKGYDEEMKTLLFTTQSSLYIRGGGGYGGRSKTQFPSPTVPMPKRAPDSVERETIPESQAALYRLSGDKNPLHIDHNFAALGGFSQPILHGLCSYGYAVRHVIRTYCGNDPARLTGFKARFTKPVLPGQTLETEMWELRSAGKVAVRCRVKETGDVVLDSAYAEVKFDENQQTESAEAGTDAGISLMSSAVFHEIGKRRVNRYIRL